MEHWLHLFKVSIGCTDVKWAKVRYVISPDHLNFPTPVTLIQFAILCSMLPIKTQELHAVFQRHYVK